MRIAIFLVYATFSLVILGYTLKALSIEGGGAVLMLGYIFHILAYATYYFGDKNVKDRSIFLPFGIMLVTIILFRITGLSDMFQLIVVHGLMSVYCFWLFLKNGFLNHLKGKARTVLRITGWVFFSVFVLAAIMKFLHLDGNGYVLIVAGLGFSVLSFFYGAYKALS